MNQDSEAEHKMLRSTVYGEDMNSTHRRKE